jgi:molybdopterin converting factor subunit 1
VDSTAFVFHQALMKIKVLFFASCRELVGHKEMEVEMAEGSSAADLKSHLMGCYPRLVGLAPVLSLAVNAEYADEATPLQEGDEVALIPPVSGG